MTMKFDMDIIVHSRNYRISQSCLLGGANSTGMGESCWD